MGSRRPATSNHRAPAALPPAQANSPQKGRGNPAAEAEALPRGASSRGGRPSGQARRPPAGQRSVDHSHDKIHRVRSHGTNPQPGLVTRPAATIILTRWIVRFHISSLGSRISTVDSSQPSLTLGSRATPGQPANHGRHPSRLRGTRTVAVSHAAAAGAASRPSRRRVTGPPRSETDPALGILTSAPGARLAAAPNLRALCACSKANCAARRVPSMAERTTTWRRSTVSGGGARPRCVDSLAHGGWSLAPGRDHPACARRVDPEHKAPATRTVVGRFPDGQTTAPAGCGG
jgi:hypothetical protein